MRAVIQRAEESSVKVNGKTVGSAGRGYMILLGVKKGDGDEEARLLARKTAALRVFEDENGACYFAVYASCRLQKGQPSVVYRQRRAAKRKAPL